VSGWVTREWTFDQDDACCGIDDVAIGSGGTIHRVDHQEEAWDPGGFDAGRYLRSTDGGRTWDAEHQFPGIDEVVAANGNKVFVAFRAYTCGRIAIGVMRNTKNGAPNAWSRVTCLPIDGDDIGSEYGPQIATSGTSLSVIAIEPRTNKVHLRTSRDSGRTFASKLLGDARPDADTFIGPVLLDADGDLVVASWPDRGKSVIRISRDGGRSWGPAVPMPSRVEDLSVRDGQILVQGPTGVEEPWWYGLVSDGGVDPLVVSWPTAKPEPTGTTPTRMVLGPAGALGAVSHDPECMTTWRASTDQGANWSPAELIVDRCLSLLSGATSSLPPSWLDDGRIIVLFDGDLVAERP
jgi:hypothetical protein